MRIVQLDDRFLRCDTCWITSKSAAELEKWFRYGRVSANANENRMFHACPKCGIPPEYLVEEMRYWKERGNKEQFDRCERWLNRDYSQERGA